MMEMFVLLLVVLLVVVMRKMPKIKGWWSEKLVFGKMSFLSEEYVVFNNLMFKSNGYSTQIDHLIVSPYGVFVIETKGYKGWILGGEGAEYWTQVIYKSKHQFYNPIKQNEGHIRFLRHLFKGTDILFISIVVFNNSADLKVNVSNHIVINRCNLNYIISRYRDIVLNSTQIDWIINTIRQNSITIDRKEIEQHKRNVKNKQYETEMSIYREYCPRCGGRLVLRQGQYGSFYGCSNYPKCKFTIKG